MKNFVNDLADLIIENERERLDNIMYDVAKNIQSDVVAVTYRLIDAYYEDYTREMGRVYIRTDEYKHPHGKKGRFRYKKKSEWASKRASDVSLRSAIKAMEGGEPVVGICRPIDGTFGYQAGVLFDEERLLEKAKMHHSVMGPNFEEWYIVENFLSGVHGNDDVHITTPSADMILDKYIYSYHTSFDKHYNNALNKYKAKGGR